MLHGKPSLTVDGWPFGVECETVLLASRNGQENGKAGATKALKMGNKEKRVTTRAKQRRVRPKGRGGGGGGARTSDNIQIPVKRGGGGSLHRGIIGELGKTERCNTGT